ncbi:sensor histidine kinase [Streptomyces sioyaensis]|uniref:sensor histidine kinase n=1 Tax=Streptomyces sioyaensis TaxID=67364 RepID=UPI0037D07F64
MASLLCYQGITIINLAGTELSSTSTWVTSLACLMLIFALQLWHSGARVHHTPIWQRSATLGAQALLTYLPLTLFHSEWGSMAGFLAGSLLLLLPSRWAVPLFCVVGLSMLIPPILDGLNVQQTIYSCQSSLLSGLVVYGLSRLAALVQTLHETRSQLAGMAVTKERLRFARDLHDLLGYSLSAITLKSELITRLIPAHPGHAVDEVSEVLTISRQALADVRAVSSGLHNMSLEQEMHSAQSLLEAAGVEVRLQIQLGKLGQFVDSMLAAVLREAVTNVLRHTVAARCSMAATQEGNLVRLTVVNDGVDSSYRDASPYSGSGLSNLRERLQSASGRLSVTRGPRRTFKLVAEVPTKPVRCVDGTGKNEPSGHSQLQPDSRGER